MPALDPKLAKTEALLRLLELEFLAENQDKLANKAEHAQHCCEAKDIDNLLILLKEISQEMRGNQSLKHKFAKKAVNLDLSYQTLFPHSLRMVVLAQRENLLAKCEYLDGILERMKVLTDNRKFNTSIDETLAQLQIIQHDFTHISATDERQLIQHLCALAEKIRGISYAINVLGKGKAFQEKAIITWNGLLDELIDSIEATHQRLDPNQTRQSHAGQLGKEI